MTKTTPPKGPGKAIKATVHRPVKAKAEVKDKKAQSAFDNLSDNEQIFVLEYLSSFNASKAAIKAGHTQESAAVLGWRMLRKVNIRAALEEEQKKRAKELRMDQSRILQEEAVIAFFDPADTFDPDTGELLQPNKLPEHIRRNLTGVDMEKTVSTFDDVTETTYKFKYKFNDKGKSLERISRQLGLYIDKTELTGKDGQPLNSGVLLVSGVVGEEEWATKAREQQIKLQQMAENDRDQ